MSFKNALAFFTSPIETEQDAIKALREISKAWYAVAAITGLAGLLLYFSSSKSVAVNVWADACLYVAAGKYLQERKSRAFAIFLLLYSLLVTGLTIAAMAGIYKGAGGKNIVLAIIVVAMAYRGVKATYVYHSSVHSIVRRKNVAVVWGSALLAIIASLIVTAGLAIDNGWSDEVMGSVSTWMMLGVSTAAFIHMSKRFPCVSH
jgi:hypothetical protein